MTMSSAPSREFDDKQRVASLHRTGILDTPSEARFDRLARLAAYLLEAPSALVSLVDTDRQWFKARHNWQDKEGERRHAICDHTIRQTDVLTVPDTTTDPRFDKLPSVLGSPHIRFYAGSAIYSPDGQPVGSLCVIDFAPRKNLSEEQRWLLQMLAAIVSDEIALTASFQNEERERQRLRDAAEAVPNGFILVDGEGTVAFVNRAYRLMFAEALTEEVEGLPYAELLGRLADAGIFEMATKNRDAWIAASLAQLGQEKASEVRLTDGRVILISNHPTAEGGMVGLRSDVTGRVLQADELLKAREAAEAASRARGEFLAVMSHEVRTPLNGVLGMLDELEAADLDQGQSELVTVAKKSAVALLENLNSLLDLSKLDAGLLSAQSAPFPLRTLAADVVGLYQSQAGAKGLQMLLNIDAALPDQVTGDAIRIRQILQNLLSNAVKFTETGSVTLALCPSRERAGWVVFDVSDTGIGIPADLRHGLFKPYSQLDASYAGKYGGTGLGLSIVKQLTELLEGTIHVSDNDGQGTRFIVSLPLPAAPTRIEPMAEVADSKPGHFLVVDDNETNRLVSRLMLERLGYTVALAGSGSEAAAMSATERFDLIITDISMEGMDGVALLEALRGSTGPNRGTPAIALTAGLSPEDEARCEAAGFLRVLVKPIERHTLEREVRHALAASAVADALTAGLNELAQELGPELIDTFKSAILRDLEKWQKCLAQAQASGDRAALAAALHGIKGACATLRLSSMEAELRQLETRGATPAAPEIMELNDQLDQLRALLGRKR